MLADMMHDALRADVLRALFLSGRGPSAEREEVKNDVGKHVATFRAAVNDDSVKAASPQVLAVLTQLRPTLERYLASATELVSLASEDGKRAEQRLGEFQKVFEDLEDKLGRLGSARLRRRRARGA